MYTKEDTQQLSEKQGIPHAGLLVITETVISPDMYKIAFSIPQTGDPTFPIHVNCTQHIQFHCKPQILHELLGIPYKLRKYSKAKHRKKHVLSDVRGQV